jgi:hypothetical protein
MTDLSSLSDSDLMGMLQQPSPSPAAAPSPIASMSDADLMKALNPPSVGADVAKSAGIGLVKGTIGLAGMPGDARDLVGRGVLWAGDKLGLPHPSDDAIAASSRSNITPTSADIRAPIEARTGQFYDPQTTPGQYMQTAAEFAPAALTGPGGVARKLITQAAIPGVASEAAGQATEGTAAEPYARIAAAIAAGVGGAKVGDMATNAKLARSAPAAPQVGNVARVGNVDVPLTPGQVTGDVTSQRYVESARKGTLGEAAKQRVLDFDAQQASAVDRARDNVHAGLGGGSTLAETPYEAADVVQRGVQSQAAAIKAQSQKLYDEFGQMQGTVGADAFRDIGQGIKGDLAAARNPYIVSDRTTPAAAQMLDHLDANLGRLKIQNKADPLGAPNPDEISGVSLRGLDQSRRELLSIARGAERGSEDARASQAVIRAFDQRLQNAVDSHLYTGDANAFETLKGARKLWATYSQTFKSQGPGDMAGKIVEKMIGRYDQPASLNDISNWLYGANGMGGSSTAVAVYKKLGGIFGQTSPELQALRQGLFSRLTETAENKIGMGPQKVSQRIFEFLNGQGRQLAETAFTSQERALIDQYGQLMKRMTPVPGSVNYSNSGHQMASMMKWTMNALATVGGLHVGGVPGAAAGFVANRVGNSLIDRTHAREVARHLYQPANQPAAAVSNPYLRRAAVVSAAAAANSLDRQPSKR